MSSPSRCELRSVQSTSDLAAASSTPHRSRPSHPTPSRALALPGSPRKISKNYHPYLVQTTSSSLLTRSPSSKPLPHDHPRHSHTYAAAQLDLVPHQEAPEHDKLEPQHTGSSIASDVSLASESSAASRKKGGLWQEWEERTRSTKGAAPTLRKAQSAWTLSSLPAPPAPPSPIWDSSDAASALPSTHNFPAMVDSDHSSIPSLVATSPRKRSGIYTHRTSPRRPQLIHPTPSYPETESSGDESTSGQLETTRKVTLRPIPQLPIFAGAEQQETMEKRLLDLEGAITALKIELEKMEGARLRETRREEGFALSFSDEQLTAAGVLLCIGASLGLVLGRMMRRR